MGLFQIPDPVSMFESAKNAGLERDIAQAFVSASLSAAITGMWRSGSAKWADWTGEGQALKDAATAMYLSLQTKLLTEKPGFLVLTVPQDLLAADNLSRFQTVVKEKKS
jgi:hypothetical protein